MGVSALKDETGLPLGSEVIHMPKRQGFLGILDVAVAFFVWHYAFWGLWGFFLFSLVMYFGGFSLMTAAALLSLYWLQIVLWKPQYNAGITWYRHVLYNPILDAAYYYLGATVIREGPAPDPSRKVMLAMAPHGVLGICRGATCGSVWTKLFPNVHIRWGSFGAAYYIPGVREFSFLVGTVDAGKATLTKRAEAGEGLALLPGGIQEMLKTDGESSETELCLNGRYGFVKLAVDHDMLLLPCFCFGEKWTCRKVLVPFWKILHKFRLAGTLILGRWCTLLPINTRPVGWVFGEPIETRSKTVEQVHEEYVASLKSIFNRHKSNFGYPSDETLVISTVKQRENKSISSSGSSSA